VQALESRISAAERGDDSGEITALNSELDSLQGRVAEMSLKLADGQALFEAIQTSMLSLQQRIAAAETNVAALAVRGDSPGKRMDLSEVEYLLRLASERLQLFGDPRSAGLALTIADGRLDSLDDPLYLPVRQRIARAMQVLEDIPAPDTLQLTNRIAALQSSIAGLPFPGELPAEPVDQAPGEETGLWARFKRTMSGLVTVRRKIPDQDIMLSLEDKDYVRQGLWLQLESARLAVMRNDSLAWRSSLQRAADTLATRFEQRSDQVLAAVSEIQSLQQMTITAEMPDISDPWAQLRLLREGRTEAVAVPPESESESEAEAESQPVTGDDSSGDEAGGSPPDDDSSPGDEAG
jgi:uroporphyrin-3 C-methyltransferase